MQSVQFLETGEFPAAFKKLYANCDSFLCAVAWGTPNPCLALLENHPKKIGKFVVGTDFYQTSPEFLSRLSQVTNCKVLPPNGSGTFHPKTYIFINPDDNVAAIVGSANFTKAAMSDNTEAMFVIRGKRDNQAIKSLIAFVSKCHAAAEAVDEDFLYSYRIHWKARRAALKQLRKFRPLKRPDIADQLGDPTQIDWDQFVALVRAEIEHRLEERLAVLHQARILFETRPSFAALGQYERKAVAGILGKTDLNPGDVDWGWFGSMKGFGIFRNMVIESPDGLSNALAAIPNRGPVEQQHYEKFCKLFENAFKGQVRTGRLPSASRLLAMKRPDYFVCFDKANKVGLSAHFGVAASSVTLETYWESIVERMQLSPWWRSSRPAGEDGYIWDGRAALLDSIYYHPQ